MTPLRLLAVLLVLATLSARAQSAGDIALVGYRADDPDEFAVVALAPLQPGTELAMTDNGWQASGSFRANEGTYRYTVPASGHPAGTVLSFSGVQGPAFSASGDQLLVYTGLDSSPTFLYALNVEGNAEWQADAISSNTSALPAGLVNGATAVALPELDNYAYTGPTEGTRSELLTAIGDPSNWTGSDTDRPAFPEAFTVTGAGGNLAPSFTRVLRDTIAVVGVEFTFDYDAIDPEAEPLTYAFGQGPQGFGVFANSGVVSWLPSESEVGQTYTVTVNVSDGETTVTSPAASVTVYAEAPNAPPYFTSSTRATIVGGGGSVSIDLDALDPESWPISFSLTPSPAGTDAAINAETGVFTWTAPADPGVYPFVVTATDREGAETSTDLFVGVQGTLFPDLRLDQLRAAVRAAYTGRTLGYDVGRDTLYAKVDGYPNGVVSGIYTGFSVTLPAHQDPSSYLANAGINAEHTWPQSMGAASEPQQSDMHILYPAKSNVNSSRGNSPYGEVEDAQTRTWYRGAQQQTTVPTTEIDEWSERGPTYFEPREAVKGDVARALLYFATMYESAASPTFLATEKPVMLAWDGLDPVSSAEVLRSGLIERFQGNVNPFVLDPSLARRAFEEAYTVAEDDPEGTLAVSVYPNPTTGQATVSVKLAAPGGVTVEVFDALGRRMATSEAALATGTTEIVLDVSGLPAGVYVVRAVAPSRAVTCRLTVVR